MAVYGSIADDNALILYSVGGPGVGQADVVAEVLFENRTMCRADDLDIKTACLGKQSLYLFAVLAYDADVVSARLISPVVIRCVVE